MGNCFSEAQPRGNPYEGYPPPTGSAAAAGYGGRNIAPDSRQRSGGGTGTPRSHTSSPHSTQSRHRRGASYDEEQRQLRHQAGSTRSIESGARGSPLSASQTGSLRRTHTASKSAGDLTAQEVSKPSNFKQGIHISIDEDGNLQVSFLFLFFFC